MCFSAAASFTGGAVLAAIGSAAIINNKEPSQRLFTAIPFIFGVQQVAEGFVWVALQSPEQGLMLRISEAVFLIAALVIWPTVVPLSILLMEPLKKRRRFLSVILAIGAAISLFHGIGMILYRFDVRIIRFHILYTLDSPRSLSAVSMTGYLIATLIPMFICSRKRVYLFGVIVVISYAVAQFFFREHLVSVWCFFAAIVSAIILWIVSAQPRPVVLDDKTKRSSIV